jgi:hypothetical protein
MYCINTVLMDQEQYVRRILEWDEYFTRHYGVEHVLFDVLPFTIHMPLVAIRVNITENNAIILNSYQDVEEFIRIYPNSSFDWRKLFGGPYSQYAQYANQNNLDPTRVLKWWNEPLAIIADCCQCYADLLPVIIPKIINRKN